MSVFDPVGFMTANSGEGGVVAAIDNGRSALMFHVAPWRARQMAQQLIASADAADAEIARRTTDETPGLTGGEAQSP